MEELNRDPASIIEEIMKDNTVRRYNKGKFLGKGGFAKCYEFITGDNNKRTIAAKVIPKATLTKNRARQKLMSEIKIHRSLQQTNIVGFEHFFEDDDNVYILLELCQNQTMNELIRRRKRLTELEVMCYLSQILAAIQYLHKQKVIHRDLKLGNLFLSSKMEIKVGDFGLATIVNFEGEKKRTICGTPNYIAPEILEGKLGHSYEVDVWSMGVVCYTMLVGKPPFETSDVKTTYRRIKMNAYAFPDNILISAAAKNLVQRLLVIDPSKRLTLDEIASHEFLTGSGPIPLLLPVSTLACPPSATYLRQFQQTNATQSPSIRKTVFDNTAPTQGFNQIRDNQKTTSQINGFNEKEKFTMVSSVQNLMQTQTQSPMNDNNAFQNKQFQLQGKFDLVSSKQPLFKSVEKLKSQPQQTNQQLSPDVPINQNYIDTDLNSLKPPNVWVTKWVDYSSKYGLGYLLQNQSCGVFFNDCTKIIIQPDIEDFIYIDRNGGETIHSLSQESSELQKKITLLNHFKNYLLETKTPQPKQNQLKDFQIQKQVYVKKWVKSKHAIMFRFSDKTVQVIFTDNTQVILTQSLRVVTYLNKNQEKSTMLLSLALESECNEMVKRLKYTKEILSQMLQNQQGDQFQKTGTIIGSRERATSKQNVANDLKTIQIPLQDGMNKLNTINDNQQLNHSIKNKSTKITNYYYQDNKEILKSSKGSFNYGTNISSKPSMNNIYASMNSLANNQKIIALEKNYQSIKSYSQQKFSRINSLQGK